MEAEAKSQGQRSHAASFKPLALPGPMQLQGNLLRFSFPISKTGPGLLWGLEGYRYQYVESTQNRPESITNKNLSNKTRT